jgi:hypothetical protein
MRTKTSTSPPAMAAAVFPLPPFPSDLCPHGTPFCNHRRRRRFPSTGFPSRPHLMLIVKSLPLQHSHHQRVALLLVPRHLTSAPSPPTFALSSKRTAHANASAACAWSSCRICSRPDPRPQRSKYRCPLLVGATADVHGRHPRARQCTPQLHAGPGP